MVPKLGKFNFKNCGFQVDFTGSHFVPLRDLNEIFVFERSGFDSRTAHTDFEQQKKICYMQFGLIRNGPIRDD